MEKKEIFKNHEIWRVCDKCGGWFDLRMGVCSHCNHNIGSYICGTSLGGISGLFITKIWR